MKHFQRMVCVFLVILSCSVHSAGAVVINFDDPGLNHLDDISNFYAEVTLNGIANPFPIGGGPFPAPATVPASLGGAAIWNPGETAPGESPPNFAVGLGGTDPGDAGILMTFTTVISSLTVTGLDFGNSPNPWKK